MGRAMLLPLLGEIAVDAVTSALTRHGLCGVRSFDLKQAIGPDEDPCAPDDGSSPCICQYVVLLAYGGGAGPVVVTAHSDDRATYLRIMPGFEGPAGRRLHSRVETALRQLVWSATEASPGPGS